ncbi:hypothetical protein Pint_36354 [Pistacia integerrima]|uniref:Uncharacterized protein n=1 Tax=Pistacia integerrima TaxID=434235 RepID=A0ACC0Y594_9ROSI|nr:hypothetical protein Pint_36354 [Pistacia integerrima]
MKNCEIENATRDAENSQMLLGCVSKLFVFALTFVKIILCDL